MPEGDVDAVIKSVDHEINIGYHRSGGKSDAKAVECIGSPSDCNVPEATEPVHGGAGDGIVSVNRYAETEGSGRASEERFRGAKGGLSRGAAQDEILEGKTPTSEGCRAEGRQDSRRESLALEGREGTSPIPQGKRESRMRGVRRKAQPRIPPQGFRPLQRCPGESSDTLPPVPPESPQESILEGEEGGRGTEEVKRAGRVASFASACV